MYPLVAPKLGIKQVQEEEEEKKSENDFMDVEDVRSNIYSSFNDLGENREFELTPKS